MKIDKSILKRIKTLETANNGSEWVCVCLYSDGIHYKDRYIPFDESNEAQNILDSLPEGACIVHFENGKMADYNWRFFD